MLTMVIRSTRMKVGLLPKRRAKGIQKRRPHPARRNMYPVPSFRVEMEMPELAEKGTAMEYVMPWQMLCRKTHLSCVSRHKLAVRTRDGRLTAKNRKVYEASEPWAS